jgi:hypothetical protein
MRHVAISPAYLSTTVDRLHRATLQIDVRLSIIYLSHFVAKSRQRQISLSPVRTPLLTREHGQAHGAYRIVATTPT